MKTLTYPLMSQSQWQQLICMLENKFSLTIKTDQGRSSQWGYSFEWCYNTAAQSLSLRCTQKPVWMPESLIETKIDKLVKKALSSTQAMNELSTQGMML